MGIVPDVWRAGAETLWPDTPATPPCPPVRPEDRDRATDVAALALSPSRERQGGTTACAIEVVDGCPVYGPEIPVTFEIAPKPVRLKAPPGSQSKHVLLVLSRLEVRLSRDDLADDRYKDWDIAVAMWPYANGWCDQLRLRGPNPSSASNRSIRAEAGGRTDWRDRDGPPSADLLSELRKSDEYPFDPYLSDRRYLVASKFLLASFLPARAKPTFYREQVHGQNPVWILGLCSASAVLSLLTRGPGWQQVLEHAATPRKWNRTWSRAEREVLDTLAPQVATIACGLALAGYRRDDDRRLFESQHNGPVPVSAYAAKIARELAGPWARNSIDKSLGEFEFVENADSADVDGDEGSADEQ